MLLKITIISLILSTTVTASPCDEALELNYQAHESYRQGFPANIAIQLLEQALQLCPQQAETYNNLAEIFKTDGNSAQAIIYYHQALGINPKLSASWYNLGEIYYQQNQFPLSLEAHLQACQTDKDSQQRVIELLKNNRYAVTEEGEIINKESLLVLYDKKRRQNMNKLITSCGLKYVEGSLTNSHVFRNFLFDTSKALLKSDSEAQLVEIAKTLTALPLHKNIVHIHGHTDSQQFNNVSVAESDRLNSKLSYDRANTIARELDELGVSITRIRIHAHGFHDPIVEGNHPDSLAQNRRVEIGVD